MPSVPNFAQVRTWLNEIGREKQASASKRAKALSEPGGYVGETTHPSKDVDDNLHKSREGSRSAENESDIKKTQPAGNVDSTSDTSKTQDSLNYNINMRQSATGEDPATEDNYKSRMKDPGTSHPANADEVGEKYSWVRKEAAQLANLANEIMADIAVSAGVSPTPATANTAQNTSTNIDKAAAAAQAGYNAATLDKATGDNAASMFVAETVKQAQFGADRVGAYLLSLMNETNNLIKQSEELPPEMLAALAGGGGAGGPPPEGGLPPEAAAGGLPPEAGVGLPPEAGGGSPPEGGDNEAALQELTMALMELGISPEQLAAAASGAGGGAGGEGGVPPEAAAGGAPPMPGSPADMGAKVASAVKDYQRSGKFEIRPAKSAAERQHRNEMKRYILEIMGATR